MTPIKNDQHRKVNKNFQKFLTWKKCVLTPQINWRYWSHWSIAELNLRFFFYLVVMTNIFLLLSFLQYLLTKYEWILLNHFSLWLNEGLKKFKVFLGGLQKAWKYFGGVQNTDKVGINYFWRLLLLRNVWKSMIHQLLALRWCGDMFVILQRIL